MDLCHSIIILPDDTVRHAVMSASTIESQYRILSGPHTLSNLSYPLVALSQKPLPTCLEPDVLDWGWSLLIVDDVAKKPLLIDQPEARALFWLGELIGGMACCFQELGFTLKSLKPSVETGHIIIEFSTINSSQTLGALLCLATAIDALLFARGLLVGSSELHMREQEHNKVPPSFLHRLKALFEHNYGMYRNLA